MFWPLTPHVRPSVVFIPVSLQTGDPVPQTMGPVWQAFPAGVHTIAAVHATHALEELHTMFVPHELPAVLFAPSTQTDDPVEQDVVPALQGLGLVVHPRLGVHEVHIPFLQNRFAAPHIAPSPSDVPRSEHMAIPVAQDCDPLWQVLAGVQVPPLLQAAQSSCIADHAGTTGRSGGLFPLSVQTDEPVAQDVAPALHEFDG